MFHLLSPQPQLTQTITQYLLISPTFPTFFSSQIIAILAAILFPVFARARDRARQASCLSNIRQITTAGLMYMQDYDEMHWPTSANYMQSLETNDNPDGIWYRLLQPYVMNEQIFKCPSDRGLSAEWGDSWDERPGTGTGVYPSSIGREFALSYGTNHDLNNRAMAAVQAPAEIAMIFESTRILSYEAGHWEPRSYLRDAARHSEQFNVGYMDGHARSHPESAYVNVRLSP